ncbi:hypothetical protein HZU73_03427 [Apis mellifera caucasica]|nr:hypothetical protein HZU73_03427 [Apis mellifera caucasica]
MRLLFRAILCLTLVTAAQLVTRPARSLSFRKGSSFFYRVNFKIAMFPYTTIFSHVAGFKLVWLLPTGAEITRFVRSVDDVHQAAEIVYESLGNYNPCLGIAEKGLDFWPKVFPTSPMPRRLPQFLSIPALPFHPFPRFESKNRFSPRVLARFEDGRTNAFLRLYIRIKYTRGNVKCGCSHGFDGRSCLLKNICQAMEYVSQRDGVIAKILKLLAGSYNGTTGNPVYCDVHVRRCPLDLIGVDYFTGQ